MHPPQRLAVIRAPSTTRSLGVQHGALAGLEPGGETATATDSIDLATQLHLSECWMLMAVTPRPQ